MTIIRQSDAKKSGGTSPYPATFQAGTDLYEALELSDVAGLTQFGVGVETLLPGGKSSNRHWHENEDEFLFVLSGEVVVIENDGDHILQAGDAAGWKAGVANGHCVENRTDKPAQYLIMGTRAQYDRVHYPDDDLAYVRDERGRRFTDKKGVPYPGKKHK